MMIVRDIYSRIAPVIASPEAVVITGMRRVGKTTLLRYIFDRIKSENKIFLDFENPANQKYFEEKNYDKILENLSVIGLNNKKQGYVFLDEIQFVKNIPSVVKYLADHYSLKFFLSGSSSFYLRNLFSESLAGRKYIFELYPLNFMEFLRFKNVSFNPDILKSGVLSESAFEFFDRYYSEYMLFGGFPGVVLKDSAEEKKTMLEDIFSSYFQLEVRQIGDFRKTNVVRDLMLLLLERTGSRLEIQKLSSELEVSRETIYNYISFLEGTYFIKLIRPFSRNRDTEIRSTPKFYACDSGLVNRFARVSEGALFENSVFWELQKKGEVSYYQKKSGVEIDFILNKQHAFEAKLKPGKNDIKRLSALAGELQLKGYKIVSRRYTGLDGIIYGFSIL